ncbi:hypothetical protein ACGFX8_29790 [Streptomyces sp. NPDC048362]
MGQSGQPFVTQDVQGFAGESGGVLAQLGQAVVEGFPRFLLRELQ